VVECQDERSQYNKQDKAMKILRSKIYEKKQREQASMIAFRAEKPGGDRGPERTDPNL
jgi:peptide chain release factor 1